MHSHALIYYAVGLPMQLSTVPLFPFILFLHLFFFAILYILYV